MKTTNEVPTVDEIRRLLERYREKPSADNYNDLMEYGTHKIEFLLEVIQNLEGLLHVVTGARDVLMSKDHVLTELAYKVCNMRVGLEQHAEYVDELKAFLIANEETEQ